MSCIVINKRQRTPKGTIKNGQSRNIGNIGNIGKTRHNEDHKKHKNGTQP